MFKNLFKISALLFLVALPGCGYTLPGRVVSGRYNTVEIVSADDPRLRDAGMPGVRIELIRDPDSLGKSVATSTSSGGSGNVKISIAEIGVGWLDEEWDIRALMGSDEFATSRIRLPRPGTNMRLLVVLEPGSGRERSSMESEQERRLDDYGISIPDSSIYRR